MGLRPVDHVRGAAVLFVAICMFLLGLPGLDLLGPQQFAPGSAEREQMLKDPWGPIAVGAADANRAVREPVVRWITPLQRPFRIAQSWGLYGGGPKKVFRMEVYVDGELVMRSNDPEARWLRSVLRSRRLRPIVDAHCSGHSKNSRGLLKYIVRKAREDFPEATEVRVHCTEQRRTPERPITVRKRMVSRAPDWTVQP